jgi:urease accessory protein
MSIDWLILQIADSAFPTGGFAHSWGLESAWQHGEVRSPTDLRAFVRTAIAQCGFSVIPFVNAAHREPARLEELDGLNEIFLTNAVANRASRVQGRSLVATSVRIWPSPALTDLEARARVLKAHVAPLAGATLRAMDVELATARQVVLYVTVRSVVAAAVRLGMVGNYEAQRIQYEATLELDAVLDRCRGLDEDAIAQIAPVHDLLQAAHDRLYSRLFQS